MSGRRVNHAMHRFDAGLADSAVVGQVVDYYAQTLLADNVTLAYLRSLGFDDDKIRDRNLGLCDRTDVSLGWDDQVAGKDRCE